MIRVRIADTADRQRLVDFVHDHWSASHVFTTNPEVFSWQHLQGDGRLNMVLAEDTGAAGSPVLGVLGFIPMGRFDPALGDTDVMLAIWKVRDEGVPPGLGLRLLKYLTAELSPRLIGAIGTSQIVRPIYELLKYRVGELHQSAIFHPERRGRVLIADRVPGEAFAVLPAVPTSVLDLTPVGAVTDPRELEAIDELACRGVPSKSRHYVEERYLRHPWYRYDVRVVRQGGQPVALVVWRTVEANGSRVLRIVDIIGDVDWLPSGGHALQQAVVAADAEYIDLMQIGIEPAQLAAAGFVDLGGHPDLVLPNYFAPFERRNVAVELAYKLLDGSDGPVRLFRADSDQDRPNRASDLE